MRELFTIDLKNYTPGGTVGRRPSVRGIIVRDGKIAMMHAVKYDYYKLPGGGIEPGEQLTDTLIREVREESGLAVIPESVKEFGMVRRIEKGKREDIFIQENYYFLCEARKELSERELDPYEAHEQFTLEFVTPRQAIETNERADHGAKAKEQTFCGMLRRENMVLGLIEKELL